MHVCVCIYIYMSNLILSSLQNAQPALNGTWTQMNAVFNGQLSQSRESSAQIHVLNGTCLQRKKDFAFGFIIGRIHCSAWFHIL